MTLGEVMPFLCGDLAQGCKVSLVGNHHLNGVLNSAVPAAVKVKIAAPAAAGTHQATVKYVS
jgi:hypothetical protein